MRDDVKVLSVAICFLLIAGCTSLDMPTAPKPPPDNPSTPALELAASWSDSSVISLRAGAEDLVVSSIAIAFARAEATSQWYQLQPDLYPPVRLTRGVMKSARVRLYFNPWSEYPTYYHWATGDRHRIDVTVHRPGQSKDFYFTLLDP